MPGGTLFHHTKIMSTEKMSACAHSSLAHPAKTSRQPCLFGFFMDLGSQNKQLTRGLRDCLGIRGPVVHQGSFFCPFDGHLFPEILGIR
jgi:hypothetical protein